MPYGARLQFSLRSEASDPRQLEIFNAATKFMEANCLKNEEPLIRSDKFVDSWIEETFVWILVTFVHW